MAYITHILPINEYHIAYDIVWRVFLECDAADYPEEGILNFRSFLDSGEIEKRAREDLYTMLVVTDEETGENIAAGGMRDGNHISLLFTEKKYQNTGAGSLMLNTFADIAAENGFSTMTVNAAPSAQHYYLGRGFIKTGSRLDDDGILCYPMSVMINKLRRKVGY